MDNREIVNKGLQARREVKTAMACAAKYRDAAAGAQDARFYDQNRHRIEQREWQAERQALILELGHQARKIQHLTEDRDELSRRLRDAKKHHLIGEAAKAILAAVFIAGARDLGWIVTWLATVLLVAASAYLAYVVATLARKK